jgi:tRNA-specific 2-thiouridylase
MAEKANLPISPRKKESQDICFIKDDYRDFLKSQGVMEKEGYFIYKGIKISKHRGIPFYCYGQRRGLAVAAGERVYIREFDTEKNTILLGNKPMSKNFRVAMLNVFSSKFTEGKYSVRVRYQSAPADCTVSLEGESAVISLEKACEIVTPGQFAVFYKDGFVYASGKIESVSLL